jgi:neutral amino acid transport system permease protein
LSEAHRAAVLPARSSGLATLRLPVLLGALLVFLLAVLTFGISSPAASAETAEPTPTPTPTGDFTNTFTIGGLIRSDDEPLEDVQVLVEGEGFSEVGTTGADGRWAVVVPGRGEYTATLQVETLPEGVAPRDPENVTRTVTVGTTNTVNVLFPTGEGTVVTTNVWDTLFTRLVYGLNFGLLLALAAIGISLIFGTTGVNNFAHGEMLTFGAIFFYTFVNIFAWSLPLALIVTLLLSAAFGWVQDAGLFKPLRRRGVGLVQVLIVTIGFSIAVRYIFLYGFGGGTQNLRTGLTDTVTVGPVTITAVSAVSMVISAVTLVLVGLFLTRTRIGKATRAVSDNASLAAASGINVDRVIRIVWVLAGLLTGLSGILYGLFRGVEWDMGFAILLLLFAAVTLGGLGSAFGALVGALVIGIFTEVSTIVIPPDLRFAVALIVLILVLLFRPQGVLGRKERIG